MAFDYCKLRGRIIEKFGSQTLFAEALDVSQRTLSLKLNNKIFFSQAEINKTIKLLDIEPIEIDQYFFAQKVQKLEQ